MTGETICEYATLPFSTNTSYDTIQTQRFTLDTIAYTITYNWNQSGQFYTAKIIQNTTNLTVFNGKLTLLNLRLYAKDPITKEIIFTIIPISVYYGFVNAIIVW